MKCSRAPWRLASRGARHEAHGWSRSEIVKRAVGDLVQARRRESFGGPRAGGYRLLTRVTRSGRAPQQTPPPPIPANAANGASVGRREKVLSLVRSCGLDHECRTRLSPKHDGRAYGQSCLTKLLISPGDANTTEARSPCMPAPTITGFPGFGPALLESVLNRKLNSHTLATLPSAV